MIRRFQQNADESFRRPTVNMSHATSCLGCYTSACGSRSTSNLGFCGGGGVEISGGFGGNRRHGLPACHVVQASTFPSATMMGLATSRIGERLNLLMSTECFVRSRKLTCFETPSCISCIPRCCSTAGTVVQFAAINVPLLS